MTEIIVGPTYDPHGILGAHAVEDGTVIRTLRRGAKDVAAIVDGQRYPMQRLIEEGIFETTVPGKVLDYRIDTDGQVRDDPYRHLPTLGAFDLQLISEGRHERLWTVLGANAAGSGAAAGAGSGEPEDHAGGAFAVWAPTARGVRVVGDFSGWGPHDGWPMRSMGASGVWELFVPDAQSGQRYKFRILGRDGVWREKIDPLARFNEAPPRTASVVHHSGHAWGDAEWIARRDAGSPWREPVSIYEVHLPSWRPGLSYVELARELTEYVVTMGFTHVELMPVMEHPYGGSWGYQVTGYYAPTARLGDPDGFRLLVDSLHRAGIGVILDWVPAHFPRDDWALARYDGSPLYEHADPQRGEHPDWGTYVFDFGRPEVRNFLVANALYWVEEFHADGLRVDAVASMLYLDYSREDGQWTPNVHGGRENLDAVNFLQELTATVYKHHPGVLMVAEESTAWPGVTRPTTEDGLGFGFKWNMGWMHDTLVYVSKDPIHRQYHHDQMTFATVYAWSENFVLPISHDEVVHGKRALVSKMPGDWWRQRATVRALLGFMWAFPGKQLLFMGCELADGREWSEQAGLDWSLLGIEEHAGVSRLVADLNAAYRAEPALWSRDITPDGFAWIVGDDKAHNVFAFERHGSNGEVLVCVANFSALPHEGYRVGLPCGGRWQEVINTDRGSYGGSDVVNAPGVDAEDLPWQGRPNSAPFRVPPLGTVWLRPSG